MEDDLKHCRTMIADQERLAAKASSAEAAEVHRQMAILYRVQLGRLQLSEPRENGMDSLPRASVGLANQFHRPATSAL